MITVRPVRRALVPVDDAAARRVSGPNYDEFQSDEEIWRLLQSEGAEILRITMAHCDAPSADAMLAEGSTEALDRAAANMERLIAGADTRVVENVLWIYEIEDPARPGVRQIGLGGMASVGEIRTEATPEGTILRNEFVHESKARGRADLVEATHAFIGTVNNTVPDADGRIARALEAHADSRPADYDANDESGCRHRVWLVSETDAVERFVKLLANEPEAYVADGNHRSAAAAMLGCPEFLAVFFTSDRMGIGPYNRLIRGVSFEAEDLLERLRASFEVETPGDLSAYAPSAGNDIGLFVGGSWHRLRPRAGTHDSSNAVECIDANIVQRLILNGALGISDSRDERINYVGGNKDAAYLEQRVVAEEFALAISLAPVTMTQFIEVCRQGRFMPPKSTWFLPKIRSGLLIALLED